MNAKAVEAVYPLSPMQQGMLFHTVYAPESGVYHAQTACALHGDLDVDAFKRAWQCVIDRHAILRTAFAWKRLDKLLQVVHRQVTVPWEQDDWRAVPPADQHMLLLDYLQTDRARGFDLAQAPLLRLALMRTADDAYQFVWSHHHLLLDGWSVPILLKDVFTCYEAMRTGREPQLEPVRPYRDYITWLQKQDPAHVAAYWQRMLAGFTAPTPLVVDHAPHGAAHYAERTTFVSATATAELQALARQHHLTLNTIVQGAWALLLHRYSGDSDVVFGATVSGRPADLPGVESMLGVFINTLPVRARITADQPVLSWLIDLQAQQVEMRQYEYSPLVDVQGWSDVPRGQSLFNSILVFENYPVDEAVRAFTESLHIDQVRNFEQTNYPLTVVSAPGDALPLKASYDCRCFDDNTIDRMLGHLRTLLENIAADPHQPLRAVPLLTEPERQQVLVDWNATTQDYALDQGVHQLFEAQAERTPDAPAVVFKDQSLTYRELNQRANQLAHYLRTLGVGPETLVAICVDRSLEMIVDVLGVLKAGGAYIPIDPSYPPDRIAFMLDDSQTKILLTSTALREQHSTFNIQQLICLDADWPTIALERDTNPINLTAPDNLAYVIYTSGSTGKPKGVLLHHRGLSNFIQTEIRDFDLTSRSRVLMFASFSFDASLGDIFGALLSGGALYLADQATLMSATDLHRLLREQAITSMVVPPAMLNILADDDLPDLHTVVSVGEACPPTVAARWCKGRRFLNGYGPTETTIGACWSVIAHVDPAATTVPIGRPLANVQAYVLDAEQRLVPIGVPGELHIGGLGVARGYLNRPDLTEERFIPNPFNDLSATVGGRLYKTGDLVRYRPDGQLEFLGRLDQQVKIRGFRIELGEIEAALNQRAAIRESVVVAREDTHGDKRLVAYLVADQPVDLHDVQDALKAQLPAYMLPSTFVVLDQLPRLPNGKIDRRALPAPEFTASTDTYVAPRTPLEELLCGIWEDVLRVPRVGVHDHFFALGGHSLLATQLASRLREALQIEVPLRELFDKPTVAELAELIEMQRHHGEAAMPPIEPAPRDGPLPLSFAQQRLWFLDQLLPGNLLYHIPTAVRLKGVLKVEALERSLNAIVQRHESLRTTFVARDGQPEQIIAPTLTIALPIVDLRALPDDQHEAEAVRLATADVCQPFDLARGPLLRAHLLCIAEDDHVIVLTMHHIVSDGWSMGVLTHELATLYAAFAADRPSPLPDLPIQYADFAHWQRQTLAGDALDDQLRYWKEQLSGSAPLLELPTDRPRPAIQTVHGAHHYFAVPQPVADALKALSHKAGATLFMTLLAAFEALLYRYTGQTDFNVGTPIANRTRAEIEGLIGFFVNTLVIRAHLDGISDKLSFYELLKRVREAAMGAYAHQDLPFEMLVETLQPQRDLSHTPLFQVMFVLDNTPRQSIALSDAVLTPIEIETGSSSFDLTLSIAARDDSLRGYFEYNTDLFEAATIEQLTDHFLMLLSSIVTKPDQLIPTLPMLTDTAQQQLLVEWNQTAADFPHDRCIHDLVEAQATLRPDALAVIFDEQTLTYRDLERRANQLARYLQHRGVGPDVLVGLATDRGPDMIVGILGILKAGGAYLPLDPYYPPDRLAFMLADSHVALVLTQAAVSTRLFNQNSDIENQQFVCLDTDWPTIAQLPGTPVGSTATPDHLAYVIYTSGSTGKPKGALLQHRGLCNLATWQQGAFGLGEGSRVLQFSPFSFDASVWETFMALRNGGTLVLARQELLAGPDLVNVLRDHHVTHVTLPPSVLNVLPPDDLPDLKVVIAAGEACPRDLVQRWAKGRAFFNAYGPTETTVCASMYHCDIDDEFAPPIGRPIANTQLYVLDANQQPVPIGVPGELHVGGVSVARGYLQRPELTAEKFVRNPFGGRSAAAGDRLYKTGDLVRYRPDGNLEFLGRIDQQVKVRGFRIELGEIESALRQHPAIRDCAVIAHDNRLIAYLVLNDDAQVESSDLKSFLKQHLPDYMLPARFIPLAALPLSPSGKVDRKALPLPETLHLERERDYVPPRTETEVKLAAIAAELLGLERVGATDNFFDLGGHSLLATQFISRVRTTCQIDLPLRTLFEQPTVAELANEIELSNGHRHHELATIDAMLKRLATLSDADARAALAESQSLSKSGVGHD
ncbi:MAG: amino acid adenylation domain-containing protein [Anaerolineae bacterium]